ncbi:EXS family-domain-containing protein [Pyronema domesticum]|uniref:Similar to Protein ERD1 homolog 2 acc. no. Q10151 n=1 Tax=Pyronema omphalodes (strain CBS 100304) TaxID=1076935 RepID=U4LNF0_PYROM|nr:EXS family-domain-containing protein [Pyronema domesticum]CCX33122.1 Similar to Protein ERD1 homolog 2; acc. no. Q10151 [Pyronema omphalodes CBS 100304]
MEEEKVAYESISLWLPLPYRVLLLFIIGLWLFSLNLHLFHSVQIDISPFLRYTRSSTESPLHHSVYLFAGILSTIFSLNLLLFWSLTHQSPDLVRQWQILPISLYSIFLLVFLWPTSFLRRGRLRFLRTLRRILIGGIDRDTRFADVLLADALTSYSKVLSDFATVLCMFFSGYSATDPIPDRSCGGAFLVPCVISIPYLIRFRQCITEYQRGAGKMQLLNALKYASAFPVIILGALEKNYMMQEYVTRRELAAGWYIAVVCNSGFAFWWDVSMDWNLSIFSGGSNAEDGPKPWGLRKRLHYKDKGFYYTAILLDLVMRCAWSVKLSVHLDFLNEMEGGIFMLELLEVCRRWVWVFFRVEKEWVAREGGGYEMVNIEEGVGKVEGHVGVNKEARED